METTDIIKSELQQLTQATILTPESPEYQNSLKRWSSAAEKQAGVVVIPKTDEDISKTVQFAQRNRLDLATVCGGHATSGAGSTQGGILIDMSQMRTVTIDDEKKTITAQGGALWEHVDRAAGEHGLATVGGVINHTGVGGLTLGGGYGWLTGQYGLVVDNLLSARIVVADGRILTASEEENPDLFWAIRGAGHNFGVVTEFTLQGYEQKDEVWAGLLGFTPDKVEKVIEFSNNLVDDETADGRSGIYCFLAVPPGGTEPAIITVVVSNTSEEEAEKRYAPLLELEPMMNTVSMVPYSAVNGLLNDIAVHGERKSVKGFSYALPLRPGFAREILNELSQMIKEQPDLMKTFVVFEHIHTNKVSSVPRDKMAYANRTRRRNGTVWMWWTDPKNDASARQKARDLKALMTAEVEKGAPDDQAVYSNFVETGDRNVEELFADNFDRLKKLKEEYDPNNVFNKMHPIVG